MECKAELLTNQEDLYKYLNDVDNDFGIPLSFKIDLTYIMFNMLYHV